MITIKAVDLTGIAIAAEIWFKKHNELFKGKSFAEELKAATKLKKELYKTNWDDDAEILIDEMPF